MHTYIIYIYIYNIVPAISEVLVDEEGQKGREGEREREVGGRQERVGGQARDTEAEEEGGEGVERKGEREREKHYYYLLL
jgi:hypothetical protein